MSKEKPPMTPPATSGSIKTNKASPKPPQTPPASGGTSVIKSLKDGGKK
jgi:hypothetical protein